LFEGLLYQFAYNLERHRLFNIRLRHWLILVCLVLPATMWRGFWGASRLAAALITLAALGVLAATWWARRQRYVRFEEHPSGEAEEFNQGAEQPPADPPPPAMSRLHTCATGFFEVSGMRRYFVETPADFTTFETGEYCVMTKVPFTRFLLLGKSRQNEVGWWYTFFQPAMIRSVVSGCLYFGLHPRPALRLEIGGSDDSQENESLYISFEDEASRSLVLAGLQAAQSLADEYAGRQGHDH
jgi:hypothetical protein